jgi:hypothetical protein
VPRRFPHAGQVAGWQLREPLDQLRKLGAAVAALAAVDLPVDFGQHHGQGHVQGCGDLAQQKYRCIARAGFEIGEIALGDIRAACQILA